MTRTIGYVPVRIGRATVPVTVEAETGAETHVDYTTAGARIVVAENQAPDVTTREVEAVLPEVQRQLARKLLS